MANAKPDLDSKPLSSNNMLLVLLSRDCVSLKGFDAAVPSSEWADSGDRRSIASPLPTIRRVCVESLLRYVGAISPVILSFDQLVAHIGNRPLFLVPRAAATSFNPEQQHSPQKQTPGFRIDGPRSCRTFTVVGVGSAAIRKAIQSSFRGLCDSDVDSELNHSFFAAQLSVICRSTVELQIGDNRLSLRGVRLTCEAHRVARHLRLWVGDEAIELGFIPDGKRFHKRG